MRLPLRTRFAALTAALVLVVASLVGLGAYLSFRASLLSRAAQSAHTEATRLVALVAPGQSTNGQTVDLADTSLTQQLATPGMLVSVARPGGALVQATPGAIAAALPSAHLRGACLVHGSAGLRLSAPPLSLACARIGSAGSPLGTVTVGVPLQGSFDSLAALRRTLILGVMGGGLLAALLSLLVARRALRPLRRIALTAETIRLGDLHERIGYRGHDELGELANVLDACFSELEQAVERQRRFAADASHELKTPLAAIRANAELLRGWAAVDANSRRAALESLDESSRRASRLVADLLQLTRAEREPARPRLLVRLDEVVLAAVREATLVRAAIPIRVARLDDVAVLGDPLGLRQVVLNLLDNALDASPPGEAVIIALSAAGDRASVTVTDHGAGVDPADRERIFDRFYSKKPPTSSQTGAGLGLAIARAIAREHEGEVIARDSAGPRTTFELTLPLATADGHAAGSRTTNRAPVSLR